MSHAFSHDDLHDCEECFLIVESNKTDTFHSGFHSYDNSAKITDEVLKPYKVIYKNPIIKEHYFYFLFNKPPPKV